MSIIGSVRIDITVAGSYGVLFLFPLKSDFYVVYLCKLFSFLNQKRNFYLVFSLYALPII